MSDSEWSARYKAETDFFSTAVAGQKVYKIHYRHWAEAEPIVIERVTKTQLVLANGTRLTRTGEVVGGKRGSRFYNIFYKPDLPHVTEEIERAKSTVAHEAKVENLKGQLERAFVNGNFNDEDLRELGAILYRAVCERPRKSK